LPVSGTGKVVNELYLDDLRAKTHRGLEGRVARGMSAGGRLFGCRTIAVPDERSEGKRDAPARFEFRASRAQYGRGRRTAVVGVHAPTVAIEKPVIDLTRPARARHGTDWCVSGLTLQKLAQDGSGPSDDPTLRKEFEGILEGARKAGLPER
jgi:hypothetical protein